MAESQLYITGATVYTPGRVIERGTVLVAGGQIVAVGESLSRPESAKLLQANGLHLVPGLIDLQVNGGYGLDFTQNPATIWEVAGRLPQTGVTSFLPTIITSPQTTIDQAQRVLGGGAPAGFRGAIPLGLHLEGPFLNLAKKGAHNPAYLRRPEISDWSPENGVRLVTLAPELAGALPLIETLAGRGLVVSAGHSLATFEQAQAAFAAGISYVTHLFNAMPPLHHRQPGLVAAALACRQVVIGLIPDGVHLHPAWLKLVWEWCPGRVNLVSDAMAALGMPPGRYQLGDFAVTVDSTRATLADGTLAGSILTLDSALRQMVAFTGRSLAEILPAFTAVPAGLLGLKKGQIKVGYDADLLLLTADLRPHTTIINGQW